MQTIIVTGASGFVGRALCTRLQQAGHTVRRALRRPEVAASPHDFVVGDIGPNTAWDTLLRDADAVVHLAARTHVMRDTAADPLALYRRVNVEATRALAQASVLARLRRFIFVSSIKVNGESTTSRPFSECNEARPEDNYGLTKWEAEQALLTAATGSTMETVVLRPPLLYGPEVKGNFLTLFKAIARGIPLPLASVHNLRSLLYVGNFVDAIAICLEHPAAAGKTYLLADDVGVSTPDLIRAIGVALGKPARLLPCPPALLKLASRIAGNSGAVARLLGSLQIDNARICGKLGWQPRCSLNEGLRRTAEWYYQKFGSQIRN